MSSKEKQRVEEERSPPFGDCRPWLCGSWLYCGVALGYTEFEADARVGHGFRGRVATRRELRRFAIERALVAYGIL